jgi:hypothetical protein
MSKPLSALTEEAWPRDVPVITNPFSDLSGQGQILAGKVVSRPEQPDWIYSAKIFRLLCPLNK